MVQEYTIDNPDELEELMKARKFHGTHTRLNVARDNETWVHPKGRTLLVVPVLSDVVKKGKIFDAVKKYHPWVEQLTLNKNLECTRHTDRNEGTSLLSLIHI